ncbi:MAG: helix-turn-helix domain-containing protein [Bacilli bacterium]
MNKPGSKHLNLTDRQMILMMIIDNKPLCDIASVVKKDPRAISREVRNRRELEEKPDYYNCEEIYKKPCKRCSRFPFVCDGCPKKRTCNYLMRFRYYPEPANKMYRITLSEARQGLNLTEAEFKKLDETIYYGVCKGQSLRHIFQAHEELPVSLRTAYRYVAFQLLSTKNIDLRRKVRLRQRKTPKQNKLLLDRETRLNRLYTDYIRFIAAHPGMPIVQIDCVESCKPIPACLLTMHFINTHFMLAFYLPKKDSESVTNVFRYLQDTLTTEEYKKLFAITLTDRGLEFSNPLGIEVDYKTGEVLGNVFYCDPQASNQKPQIEHNHTLLRYVVPKSTNLTFLQDSELLELLVSHLNSYYRAAVGANPYHLFSIYYGQEILDKLKVRAVHPDDVHLKPDLFTK